VKRVETRPARVDVEVLVCGEGRCDGEPRAVGGSRRFDGQFKHVCPACGAESWEEKAYPHYVFSEAADLSALDYGDLEMRILAACDARIRAKMDGVVQAIKDTPTTGRDEKASYHRGSRDKRR
jgi:hypothetical protein